MSPTDAQYGSTVSHLHDQTSSLAFTGLDMLPLVLIMLILAVGGIAIAIKLHQHAEN